MFRISTRYSSEMLAHKQISFEQQIKNENPQMGVLVFWCDRRDLNPEKTIIVMCIIILCIMKWLILAEIVIHETSLCKLVFIKCVFGCVFGIAENSVKTLLHVLRRLFVLTDHRFTVYPLCIHADGVSNPSALQSARHIVID